MSNFQNWLNKADMPERDAQGRWVDLETGIPYNRELDYATSKPRYVISSNAAAARDTAKLFGGKALEGTPKQKEWAEKIRAEKLGAMTQDQAEMACDPAGLGRKASFWIDNSSKNGQAIGDFFMMQKGLLRQAMALKAAGKATEYAAAAAKYNALTALWIIEKPALYTRR